MTAIADDAFIFEEHGLERTTAVHAYSDNPCCDNLYRTIEFSQSSNLRNNFLPPNILCFVSYYRYIQRSSHISEGTKARYFGISEAHNPCPHSQESFPCTTTSGKWSKTEFQRRNHAVVPSQRVSWPTSKHLDERDTTGISYSTRTSVIEGASRRKRSARNIGRSLTV